MVSSDEFEEDKLLLFMRGWQMNESAKGGGLYVWQCPGCYWITFPFRDPGCWRTKQAVEHAMVCEWSTKK